MSNSISRVWSYVSEVTGINAFEFRHFTPSGQIQTLVFWTETGCRIMSLEHKYDELDADCKRGIVFDDDGNDDGELKFLGCSDDSVSVYCVYCA